MKSTAFQFARGGAADLCRPALLAGLLLLPLIPAAAQEAPPAQPPAQPGYTPPQPVAPDPNAPLMPQVPTPNTDDRFAPFQPVPLTQSVPPGTQNVNATGGIITRHAPDVFTRSSSYQGNDVRSDEVPEPDQSAIPLEEVIARPPALIDLNVNSSTVDYTHRHLGALTIGAEVTGTYTTNLFNTYQEVESGSYVNFGFPIAYTKESDITHYMVYYRQDVTLYPGNTELNHTLETFAQDLSHSVSDITKWDWQLAGGRIVNTGDYLPSVVAIGNTGVGQAEFAAGLEPIYNAASTFTLTHRTSEHDTVIASGTAGWLQEPYNVSGQGPEPAWSRQLTTGGDLQYQHALNTRQALGVEATEIYVDGRTPVGNSNFITLLATFQQTLSPHGSLHLGVGPMFGGVHNNVYPGLDAPAHFTDDSYDADAVYNFETQYTRISAGYQRIVEAGYLYAATPANNFFITLTRPLSRTLTFSLDAREIRMSSVNQGTSGAISPSYDDFVATASLNKHLTPDLLVFISGATTRQSATGENISRDDFIGGISFTFGNPFTHLGAR